MPRSQAINNMIRGFGAFMKHAHKAGIIQAADGKCIAKMTVEESDLNSMGDLDTGCAMTIVDAISSGAAQSLDTWDEPTPSVNMDLTRVKSTKLGDELTIVSSLLRIEGKMAYLDVEIFNQLDELIIKAKHIKFGGTVKKQ